MPLFYHTCLFCERPDLHRRQNHVTMGAMNNTILIDIAGWVGVAVFLIAYAMVSTRKMEGDSIAYQLLNVVGGVLLVVNSIYYRALPSVGVNVAWIGIAGYAMARKRFSTPKG
jgi:hypothetical protein